MPHYKEAVEMKACNFIDNSAKPQVANSAMTRLGLLRHGVPLVKTIPARV